MLTVKAELVAAAKSARSAADVIPLVEAAIALEHATIPLYITAWLTLKSDVNDTVASVIHGVFLDEMLHMGLMANLLVALGAEPRFADPAFVPKYPDQMPFGIGGGLTIKLRKCDLAQIDLFVAIEKPEHPLVIPEQKLFEADLVVPPPLHFDTIGAFYEALRGAVAQLPPEAFANPRLDRQVSCNFDPYNLTPIATAADAVAAIDLIRLQGEGAQSPFAAPDVAAHYYAFEQIAKGKRLRQTPAGPVFGPDPMPFDPAMVTDMEEDVGMGTYAAGSPQRAALDKFVDHYSEMLRRLEASFTGNPDQFFAAVPAMRKVMGAGREVLALDSPTTPGKKAGLTFAYSP